MSKVATRAHFHKVGTQPCYITQCQLCRKCASCFITKSCFNKRHGNEIFNKKKYLPGPHQFIVYRYVKMFPFNKCYCNENTIQIPPAMKKKSINITRFVTIQCTFYEIYHFNVQKQETGGGGGGEKGNTKAHKGILIKDKCNSVHSGHGSHGRNSMSNTSQYTIMSPLQPKCQPSNAFHPPAAEQLSLKVQLCPLIT